MIQCLPKGVVVWMKERIEELRKALKLSQGEFGEKIGLAASGVSGIETGYRIVQERHIKLILSAFPDVSEDWLRNGVGEMFKASSSEAERLVKKYKFPDIVRKLLTVYEGMNDAQKEAVLEYAQRVIASLIDGDGIEAKVAAYREELLSEKDTRTLSASQTGNGTTD